MFIFIAQPFFKLSRGKIKINEGEKKKEHAPEIHLSITPHGYTHLRALINTDPRTGSYCCGSFSLHIVPFLLISTRGFITQWWNVMKHRFLCLKVTCSMWRDIQGFDNSITARDRPGVCCHGSGDHMIAARSIYIYIYIYKYINTILTGPCNARLIETSLCRAGLITAEKCTAGPPPCSHVWALSSKLVWQSQINTQSKGFLPFGLSVASTQWWTTQRYLEEGKKINKRQVGGRGWEKGRRARESWCTVEVGSNFPEWQAVCIEETVPSNQTLIRMLRPDQRLNERNEVPRRGEERRWEVALGVGVFVSHLWEKNVTISLPAIFSRPGSMLITSLIGILLTFSTIVEKKQL